MSNFFTDNPDLDFYLRHGDWHEVVELRENRFADADKYDDAPRDYEDAIDSYWRVLQLVGELAGERISVRATGVDEEGCILQDGKVQYASGIEAAIRELSQADLMGFTLPRRYGGLNLPTFLYTMAIEMVSQADASLMTIFGLQDIAETIHAFADEATKEEYLPRFSSGEVTGAMVLTEPDAGSDLQAVALRAEEDPQSACWRLNGVKRFISNGCGHVLLVLARSEPRTTDARGLSLFLCERGPGVKIRRLERKLGIRGSPTCEIQFVNTPARLIGQRRRGLTQYVMALMNGARLGIAGQAVGIAQAAYVAALDFANAREQFGKKIKDIPPVRDMLAEMKTQIEAARALNMETAKVVDLERYLGEQLESGKTGDREQLKELKARQTFYKRCAAMLTPMAKLFATEMCQTATTNAIQVHGGSGYMKDYPVERYFRDARITNIYEGTSQLQVVAAILGVTSGTCAAFLADLDRRVSGTANFDLLEHLRQHAELTKQTIDHFNSQDEAFRQLYARDLVDSAMDLINSYLLLETAPHSDHKKIIARRYITQALPRIRMRRDRVLAADRSTLDNFDAILHG
jgi:hypothetical protein